MAGKNVIITVRSNLNMIADQLKEISEYSKQASNSLTPFVEGVADSQGKQIKNTKNALQTLRSLVSRITKGMSDDFKAAFSAFALSHGLKLGSVFGDSIKQTLELNNQIRKLGSVFGIAENNFVSFQTKLIDGLGEIGLGADSAISALKGLSETQVRGEDNLVEYAKLSGQLASVTQEAGGEGNIAKGIAETVTAKGGNPNDIKEARSVAENMRKAYTATGMKPTEILTGIKEIFATMSDDYKKKISTAGLINLAVISKVAGPNSTKFIEDFLKKSPIARKSLEARGFKDIFGAQGLNVEKFKEAASALFKTIPQDKTIAAQTLGIDEDTAKGLIMLYQSLDKVDAAQKKVQNDNTTLTQAYYNGMTTLEAFTASLNKFKSSISEPISIATNWITDALKASFGASLSDIAKVLLPKDLAEKVKEKENKLPDILGKNLGSTLTVLGGGALAALLTGGGIKGVMGLAKGKAGGLAERELAEKMLGEKVQSVYLTNTDELANKMGAGISAPLGNSIMSLLGKSALVGAAGFAGYEVGQAGSDILENAPQDSILGKLNSTLNLLVGAIGDLSGIGSSSISTTPTKTSYTNIFNEYMNMSNTNNAKPPPWALPISTKNKRTSTQQ